MDFPQMMLCVCFIELFILWIWGMTAGWKFFRPGTFFTVIALGWLALDGGLVRTYFGLGVMMAREQPWPPPGSPCWPVLRAIPLVLAAAVTLLGARSVMKHKPGKPMAVAISLLAATSLLQGLARLDFISVESVLGLVTAQPLDRPWVTLPANAVWASVLLSFMLIRNWPGPATAKQEQEVR